VELQFGGTGHELHVSIGFAQQSRQVCRRRTATDHNDTAASEPLKVVVLETMGKEFGGQMGQIRGYVCEVGDPDGEHYAPGFDHLAILKFENKTVRGMLDADNEFFL
jgi:hypothetical protein